MSWQRPFSLGGQEYLGARNRSTCRDTIRRLSLASGELRVITGESKKWCIEVFESLKGDYTFVEQVRCARYSLAS